jgi:hypothetical protein
MSYCRFSSRSDLYAYCSTGEQFCIHVDPETTKALQVLGLRDVDSFGYATFSSALAMAEFVAFAHMNIATFRVPLLFWQEVWKWHADDLKEFPISASGYVRKRRAQAFLESYGQRHGVQWLTA